MPLRGQPRWHQARIKIPGTPLGIGFLRGQLVYVGIDEPGATPGLRKDYPVVFNGTQTRFLSTYQVGWALEDLREVENKDDVTAAHQKLERVLLRSPRGILLPPGPFLPPEYRKPRWLPDKYLGWRVHLVDWCPFIRTGLWMADWWPGHIFFQRKWIMRVVRAGFRDQIIKTLEHEYNEAHVSLPLAQILFPTATDQQIEGLAQQFSGFAHQETTHIVDGFETEAAYDAALSAVNKAAGLGAQDA